MSDRVRELAARQAALERRCAEQRASIAREVAAIGERFRSTDRAAALVSVVLRPPVFVVAIATLLLAGRIPGLRVVARALLFVSAARRLMRAAKSL